MQKLPMYKSSDYSEIKDYADSAINPNLKQFAFQPTNQRKPPNQMKINMNDQIPLIYEDQLTETTIQGSKLASLVEKG